MDLLVALGGAPPRPHHRLAPVERAVDHHTLSGYRKLRRRAFVDEQRLFRGHDLDEHDAERSTIVLVVRSADREVLGGVRLYPRGGDPTLGWWQGGRLVCSPGLDRGRRREVAAALVRAACATAELEGALRFDATVQPRYEPFFSGLGWQGIRPTECAGRPHLLMRRPIDRIERLVRATKAPLAGLLDGLAPGGAGWVGDDGAPVPGSDLVAATDAIVPSLVERDPEWAGWCGVLVSANDLAAMGAERLGALDAVAGPDAGHVGRVLAGLRAGAQAFGLPIVGGHTQVGAPAALSVTGLGRAERPVPGGGGRIGDRIRLTADVGGRWRPGYTGTQWDSTTARSRAEIDAMLGSVGRARPRAAKDVSMAGVAGTLGMIAEASGCGAELRVADVPRPRGASLADWMTCFPGFAMLSAEEPGTPIPEAGPARSAVCGTLSSRPGVELVWPDGERTTALAGPATGLGAA